MLRINEQDLLHKDSFIDQWNQDPLKYHYCKNESLLQRCFGFTLPLHSFLLFEYRSDILFTPYFTEGCCKFTVLTDI